MKIDSISTLFPHNNVIDKSILTEKYGILDKMRGSGCSNSNVTELAKCFILVGKTGEFRQVFYTL
ncbi:MAG: hypothetical protein COB26_04680 [Piscirickettsiaceae bacterium]|nr:MAG: hypothetical protein COB89_00420 [Piscirickettsiaceae bacterium]PCI70283.1 MAG: hypothetical protein COB26_04680 [Piscirickettsiaceae bacterium]